MARITGLDAGRGRGRLARVLDKLASEPVEDLRLDLEDGYGLRPDDEEDRHAVAIGEALAGLTGDGMPFRSGVRVKSLEAPTRRRGVRSLDLVLGQLGGALPAGFVVTLPKVTSVDQVQAMVLLCERLEAAHRLAAGSLRFELQVETPQAVLGADGTATVARAVHAAQGRCTGLHFGTYDYSAALGVAAAQQAMDHPVADHATSVMQVAAAQTGVRVSHGSTNILPVGDRAHVEAAWALHARLVLRSLERGIYQGWDLHAGPAADPLPGDLRVLPVRAARRGGPARGLPRPAGVRRARRAGHRLRPGRLPPAGARLRRRRRRRGACRRRPGRAGAASAGPADRRRCAAGRAVRRRAARGAARGVRVAALGRRGGRPRRRTATSTRCWQPPSWRSRCWTSATSTTRSRGTRGSASAPKHASSALEQAGVGDDVRAALAAGNREYEARFGHVYLVAASGRTGEELLAILGERLSNDPARERAVVREELGTINRLRLQRLVEEQ